MSSRAHWVTRFVAVGFQVQWCWLKAEVTTKWSWVYVCVYR